MSMTQLGLVQMQKQRFGIKLCCMYIVQLQLCTSRRDKPSAVQTALSRGPKEYLGIYRLQL